MTREQFEWTAKVVWATLEPWLKLHFGEKCPDYEFGCECCQRWKLAEELLAYDRIGTPAYLQQEIATLEECLQWRKELLASMTAGLPGSRREDQTMKIFIWCDVDTMSDYYHSNGGVVAFAETEERAREIANVGGCAIKPEEKPDDVREVVGGEEKVYYMPNAGCC